MAPESPLNNGSEFRFTLDNDKVETVTIKDEWSVESAPPDLMTRLRKNCEELAEYSEPNSNDLSDFFEILREIETSEKTPDLKKIVESHEFNESLKKTLSHAFYEFNRKWYVYILEQFPGVKKFFKDEKIQAAILYGLEEGVAGIEGLTAAIELAELTDSLEILGELLKEPSKIQYIAKRVAGPLREYRSLYRETYNKDEHALERNQIENSRELSARKLIEFLSRKPSFIVEKAPDLLQLIPACVHFPEAARVFLDTLKTFRDLEYNPHTATIQRAERLAQITLSQESQPSPELRRENFQFFFFSQGTSLPDEFVRGPMEYTAKHGKKLKERATPWGMEVIWKIPLDEGKHVVMKRVQRAKMPSDDYELQILQKAQLLNLPTVKPIALLRFDDGPAYGITEYVEGFSGIDLASDLQKDGLSPLEIAQIEKRANEEMNLLAERYRQEMNLDKPWHMKDCLIKVGEDLRVEVTPLDWERAYQYNPLENKEKNEEW